MIYITVNEKKNKKTKKKTIQIDRKRESKFEEKLMNVFYVSNR